MLAQGYVLGLLLGRGFRRHYPAFTAFMAFCVLRSLVLFYVAHEAMDLYQIVLWGSYLPQLVLLIMLVVEGFQCLFSPISTLPKGTLAHFIEASCACLGVVTVLTLMYPGESSIPWVTCMWAMDQATSWVLFTIFGLTAIMATYLGIPWRHRLFGIALGFSLYLAVDCIVTTVSAQSQLEAWPIGMVAFLGACIIWAYFFATSEVERTPLTLDQLRQLQAILHPIRVSLSQRDSRSNTVHRPLEPVYHARRPTPRGTIDG
jgi:Ca2+/Na+ antiporter